MNRWLDLRCMPFDCCFRLISMYLFQFMLKQFSFLFFILTAPYERKINQFFIHTLSFSIKRSLPTKNIVFLHCEMFWCFDNFIISLLDRCIRILWYPLNDICRCKICARWPKTKKDAKVQQRQFWYFYWCFCC